MKHAYYAFTGGEHNFFERQQHAIDLGCHGIEYINQLELATPDVEYAKKLRENADRLQLPSPCFSVYAEVMADPKASVETLNKYIDMGAVLGCSFFHHTYGPILEGQTKSEYLKTAVRVAKETAAYAGERGMELLIEPQGATMNGVEMLSAYFDKMGDDAWLILDTGNIFESGDTSLQLLNALSHKVRHVHIKDMIYRDKLPAFADANWRHCPNGSGARQTVVGTGVVDFAPLFEKLAKMKYDGWFALEYDAPETFDLYYPASYENFKAMYARAFQ